jgi:hypothetical protein
MKLEGAGVSGCFCCFSTAHGSLKENSAKGAGPLPSGGGKSENPNPKLETNSEGLNPKGGGDQEPGFFWAALVGCSLGSWSSARHADEAAQLTDP